MSRDALFSAEGEQSVLGGLLLTSGKALIEIQDKLVVDDFFRADHRLIYGAIVTLDGQERPADGVTVIDYLTANGQLEACGGSAYVGRLIEDTPSAANIVAYARIVKGYSLRRRLIQAAYGMIELANDPREVDEVVSLAQQRALDVGKDEAQLGPRPIGKLLPEWVDRLDKMFHVEHEISGVPTGFTDLDKKINGLQRGSLIIVAGRPSMGKSALSTNFLNYIANYKGLPALMFSLEMSGPEMVSRVVSQTGRVPLDRLMSGNLDDSAWAKVNEAADRLTRSRIVLDESPALMLSQIRARARRIQQKHGQLGIIVIDYIQLLSAEGTNSRESRAQQISDITRGLKQLAKELDVPIVALSQLNRDVDKREDKRPRLSDLRESGSIEQDADVILFVYRDVVYNPDTRHKNIAEIIIGKQRNGPIGTVLLYYFGEFTMFGQIETSAQQSFWSDRYGKQRNRDDAFAGHEYRGDDSPF